MTDREIVIEIAKGVMGWRPVLAAEMANAYEPGTFHYDHDMDACWYCPTEPSLALTRRFNPFEWADAGMVLEALTKKLPYGDFDLQHGLGEYWGASCCYDKASGGFDEMQRAPTGPRAICLAACEYALSLKKL